MTVTVKKVKTQQKTMSSGLRPVDPIHDLPAIVELIALGFAKELDPQGEKMLAQMRQIARHSTVSYLAGKPNMTPGGFVWVEDQHVVANLSLRYALPANTHGQLIGNVVVHPDYRGMGIARALMEAAINTVRAQGYRWLGLEVRQQNEVAVGLYTRLGFEAVGKQQHLVRPAHTPWSAAAPSSRLWHASKPRHRLAWRELANIIYGRRQKWVLEVRPGLYSFGGWERKVNLWLSGEREHAWFYGPEGMQMAVHVRTDVRRHFHTWDVLVHPQNVNAHASAVVAKAQEATLRFPNWPVATITTDQPALIQALYAAGFTLHRTLVQMVLEF